MDLRSPREHRESARVKPSAISEILDSSLRELAVAGSAGRAEAPAFCTVLTSACIGRGLGDVGQDSTPGLRSRLQLARINPRVSNP
jgi:hypothetical protein